MELWLAVLHAMVKGLISLPVLIAVLAPGIFISNWRSLIRRVERLNRTSQIPASKWSSLIRRMLKLNHTSQIPAGFPSVGELQEGSWAHTIQDHTAQVFTLFVAWAALLYSGISFFLEIVQNHSVRQFMSTLRVHHEYWATSAIIFFVIGGLVVVVGVYLFRTGTFSDPRVIDQYRYEVAPHFLGHFYLPPLWSPITICRALVVLISWLFATWKEMVVVLL